jgi:MFS family permease
MSTSELLLPDPVIASPLDAHCLASRDPASPARGATATVACAPCQAEPVSHRADAEVPDGAAAGGGPRAWLTRNLVTLSAVSFLQDTASELLYPILPLFITVVLGAPASVLGAVEGLADGASALVSPLAGRAADRTGRKHLISSGYGLAALGKVLLAVAVVWPVALVARVVDRVGKGLRGSPRDALIADGVAPAQRGRAFGFHRTMDTLGAVIGPLLALAGYEVLHRHLRELLWLAVGPAVLSVALTALIRDPRERPNTRTTGTHPRAEAAPALPAPYRRVVVALTLFSLANFPDALLLLRLKFLGFSVPLTILAYATYNAVYALASFPAGALSDRLSRSRIYAVGLAFFALGYLGLGLVHSRAVAWMIFGAYGFFRACTDGVGKAWASSLVGPSLQGRAQGVFQGLTGAATIAAGVWAGLVWHRSGAVPLLVSGSVAALAALWLWFAPLDEGLRSR